MFWLVLILFFELLAFCFGCLYQGVFVEVCLLELLDGTLALAFFTCIILMIRGLMIILKENKVIFTICLNLLSIYKNLHTLLPSYPKKMQLYVAWINLKVLHDYSFHL